MKLSVFCILIIYTLGACNETNSNHSSHKLADSQWVLHSLAKANGAIIKAPQNQSSLYAIDFENENKYLAQNNCNGVRGTYTEGNQDEINISSGIGPLRGCPNPDSTLHATFMSLLTKATRYSLNNSEDTLRLSTDAGDTVILSAKIWHGPTDLDNY